MFPTVEIIKDQRIFGCLEDESEEFAHAAAHDKIKYRDLLNRIVALGMQRSAGRAAE